MKSEIVFTFSDTGPCLLPESLPPGEWISYRLYIRLQTAAVLAVGRLGTFPFPAGDYCYTGSARRNLPARVNRHLRRKKVLRWHIDYLLTCPVAGIWQVEISTRPECELVQELGGAIVVPGFGASDCRAGCGSHLRWLKQ